MPSTFANNRTVAHKGSGGSASVFPDVCKTPTAPAVIPIAYPNTAPPLPSGSGTLKKKVDGGTAVTDLMKMSLGDMAGRAPGLISHGSTPKAVADMKAVKNELLTLGFSEQGARCLMEGKPVTTSGDQMLLYSILSGNRP
jgi:hypothetical protein